MASTTSNLLLNLNPKPFSRLTSPKPTPHSIQPNSHNHNHNHNRRQLLLILTASTAITAIEMPAMAEDIGLFGLRKKLKKAEEEAEVIMKEGFESAERGVEAVERGVEAAEKGIEAAEKGIETAEREIGAGFGLGGGLTQAGVVVGAEVVGVLVATSVVNGILGSES